MMAYQRQDEPARQNYVRRQYPELEEGIRRFPADELQRIEQSIATLAEASIQVADAAPSEPSERHGPVRRDTLGPTGQRHYGLDGLHRKRLGCGLIHYT